MIWEGVGAGTLKCIRGFNNNSIRNNKINKGLTDAKFLQYNMIEDWEDVALCPRMQGMQQEFLEDLEKNLLKIKGIVSIAHTIDYFISDAIAHLSKENEYKFLITQSQIGFK